MLKGAIRASRPSGSCHVDYSQLVFMSIRAPAVDLFIVISNNIKVVQAEFVLIRSKHLSYCNVVRSTGNPSTGSRLELWALFKRSRSRTRPNRSYIKSCMNRGSNCSLLKGRRRWRGVLDGNQHKLY